MTEVFNIGDLVTQRKLESYQERYRSVMRVTAVIGFGGRFHAKEDDDNRTELGGSYTTAEWVKYDPEKK